MGLRGATEEGPGLGPRGSIWVQFTGPFREGLGGAQPRQLELCVHHAPGSVGLGLLWGTVGEERQGGQSGFS